MAELSGRLVIRAARLRMTGPAFRRFDFNAPIAMKEHPADCFPARERRLARLIDRVRDRRQLCTGELLLLLTLTL